MTDDVALSGFSFESARPLRGDLRRIFSADNLVGFTRLFVGAGPGAADANARPGRAPSSPPAPGDGGFAEVDPAIRAEAFDHPRPDLFGDSREGGCRNARTTRTAAPKPARERSRN